MFKGLTERLQGAFSALAGKRKLTEENIAEAVTEVRLALLEADVAYGVVKQLIKRLKERVLGDEVLRAVAPAQQFVKAVHDELVRLMGGAEAELLLPKKFAVILLCGLQGSGKTTTTAKLAHHLQSSSGRRPLLVGCDLRRPAAMAQLKTLGEQIGVPVYVDEKASNPTLVVQEGRRRAQEHGCDLMIVDTAGRLHVDRELMDELRDVVAEARPDELLFVANGATGQDALRTAETFNREVSITGSILTMLDGSARGGAAISIAEVTGKPLKFEGIGEGTEDLQLFHPESMADRILGMGDAINLVKQAEKHINEEQAKGLERKLLTGTFTYDDYLQQMGMMKKMGPISRLMGMLPGAGGVSSEMFEEGEARLKRMQAMIQSMTPRERSGRDELSVSRRRRIAQGSGRSLSEVDQLVKSFKQGREMFKNFNAKSFDMKQLQKVMGGAAWR